VSDWDRMLGAAALGRDLVPLDRVRSGPAQRSPGLVLLDQPRVPPARLASANPEAIFRLEALEFRTGGHDVPGRVVRLGSRWIRWTYRATLILVLAAVASTWFIRTGETTTGPAVVEGVTVTALLPAVVAPDLAHAQELTVTLPDGQPARVSGLRVQLAGAAAIRAAGLTPLSQPAILVTGRLVPGSSARSAGQRPQSWLRTQTSVVLRSESVAGVLARQFGAMLGRGTTP
jgi:hypothetical protein